MKASSGGSEILLSWDLAVEGPFLSLPSSSFSLSFPPFLISSFPYSSLFSVPSLRLSSRNSIAVRGVLYFSFLYLIDSCVKLS